MASRIFIESGMRFGSTTAMQEKGRDKRQYVVWVFQCDCGHKFTARVSNASYGVRKLGWFSCVGCYHKAGGWEQIAADRRLQ